ncbi:MAG TPA: 50S ribosomal protein L4 [Elusimicrobiota bacterium]|nr:50S ribosomal protein L4 [Elusimicrobiota bacterium]
MEAKVLDVGGKEVGKCDLPEAIFGHKPSRTFLQEYITVYLANQRQYGAHTKGRSEISGGGKKPWKQKHTGRARAGSIRSGLWRHGAIIHGPRSGYGSHLEFPRQKAKLALAHALSARAQDGGLVCVKELSLKEAKTKLMAGVIEKLGGDKRVLVVLDAPNAAVKRASRNLQAVELVLAADLNAYDVLKCKKLIITQPALEKLGARWN